MHLLYFVVIASYTPLDFIINDNFYSSQIWYWTARDKSAAADQFLATNLGVIRIEEHLNAFRKLRNNNYIKKFIRLFT